MIDKESICQTKEYWFMSIWAIRIIRVKQHQVVAELFVTINFKWGQEIGLETCFSINRLYFDLNHHSICQYLGLAPFKVAIFYKKNKIVITNDLISSYKG